MNHLRFWSQESNEKTGAKFEKFKFYLNASQNGEADVDALIASDYGKALTEILETRFSYEEDPMGKDMLAYYESLGIKKEMFETENYYTRWVLLTPLDMVPGKKYPLVFMHHGGGNSIETDELCSGFNRIAGKEGFMACYLQNSNWQNVERVISVIAQKYPLDEERIYITGYSQGGSQTSSAAFRMPEKFAACAPCGNEIFRVCDTHNVLFTDAEIARRKEAFLPFMQVVGCCEMSNITPLNDRRPRKPIAQGATGEPYENPAKHDSPDPTRLPAGTPMFFNGPPEGADPKVWSIQQLNKRLDTLNCEPRDADKCIAYLDTPEDELHHALGFYGDKEEIQIFHGYKHFTIDINNCDGINAFRYVAVENSPHWPPVMMGELVWNFFKQFRRDAVTGKIVVDEYRK